MASGFFAILDDIALLMDDVALASKVATRKTAGILGDDLAVNAEKATGFVSTRELPVLWAITKGSTGLNIGSSTTTPIAPGQSRTVTSPPGSPQQQNAAAEQNRGVATDNLSKQLDGTTVKVGVTVTKDNKFVSAGGTARIINTTGTVRTIMNNVDAAAIDRANEINAVRRSN